MPDRKEEYIITLGTYHNYKHHSFQRVVVNESKQEVNRKSTGGQQESQEIVNSIWYYAEYCM